MVRAIVTLALTALIPIASLAQTVSEAEKAPSAPEVTGVDDSAASPSASQTGSAPSPPPEPRSLDELLEMVNQGFPRELAEDRQREDAFVAARNDQERILAESKQSLARLEERSQVLEEVYNENEVVLADDEARLNERLGQLGELFGVVRLVATDLSGAISESLTTSQLGDRHELLDRLGRSKGLPSTEDLERLWYELHREMTAQGKVVRYETEVLTVDGEVDRREVIRAGPFSAFSRGRYLLWESADQKLRELTRQPPSRYVDTLAPFEAMQTGVTRLAMDPSRGSLLNALTDTPNFQERVQQGGYVGYVIIGLGSFALLLGLVRWAAISNTARKVERQRKSDRPDDDNPLGRVLAVFDSNRDADVETLELKLDEAVLRESSHLGRFLWLVKVVSVVAPLLGLLGTVTGMIQTFQAITLFGAGDPKMMAGGISEALVTTMLGLTIAIPLVLLHATLANSTRRIENLLDEQSAGLIAMRAEQADV